MPIAPTLEAPPRFGDLTELQQIFAALRPQMMVEIAGVFAKKTPALSVKETKRQEQVLHRLLRGSRPYLIGLWLLGHPEDRGRCFYALFEGLLKEQIRAGGRLVREDQDAFGYLLKATEEMCRKSDRVWAKSIPYLAVKNALYEFCVSLHQAVPPITVENLMAQWGSSKEARKFAQATVVWPTSFRRLRRFAPQKLTSKAASELAREYSWSSALLEQRLRLLVWIEFCAQRTGKKWVDFQKVTLPALLQACESSRQLSCLPPLFDRHVRNALAHGQPELNIDRQECTFHDRDQAVIWTISEFFRNTRCLTVAVRALLEFESVLKLVQVECLVSSLWSRPEFHLPSASEATQASRA